MRAPSSNASVVSKQDQCLSISQSMHASPSLPINANPQLLQLFSCPPVQLLRLPLPRTDKRDLGPQRCQPSLNRRLLARLQDLEPAQRVPRLFQRDVRLACFGAQHLGAVLVPAEVQAEFLFEFVALLSRGEKRFQSGLPALECVCTATSAGTGLTSRAICMVAIWSSSSSSS